MSEAQIYCLSHPAVATYSVCPFVGILIHGIEYGINDYVYASSEYEDDKTFYHKRQINYDKESRAFFVIGGLKVYLDECIRTEMR